VVSPAAGVAEEAEEAAAEGEEEAAAAEEVPGRPLAGVAAGAMDSRQTPQKKRPSNRSSGFFSFCQPPSRNRDRKQGANPSETAVGQ